MAVDSSCFVRFRRKLEPFRLFGYTCFQGTLHSVASEIEGTQLFPFHEKGARIFGSQVGQQLKVSSIDGDIRHALDCILDQGYMCKTDTSILCEQIWEG